MIACADELREQGINYQRCIHVTAQDLDATACHMAYVQLSLQHIPAIVIRGNSLAVEVREYWVTPAHVLGFWDAKLSRREKEEGRVAHAVPAMPEPMEVVEASAPSLAEHRSVIVAQRAEQLGLF